MKSDFSIPETQYVIDIIRGKEELLVDYKDRMQCIISILNDLPGGSYCYLLNSTPSGIYFKVIFENQEDLLLAKLSI